MKRSFLPKSVILGALAALVLPVSALELSLIRSPLENTGVDADARGTVSARLTSQSASLRLHLKGLTPATTYHVLVGDEEQADFTATTDGRANLSFTLDSLDEEFLLDFDPRGEEIAISDGTDVILSAVVSGEGEAENIFVHEATELEPVDDTVEGYVQAHYLATARKTRFLVQMIGVEPGDYTLNVGGIEEASFEVGRFGSKLLIFEEDVESDGNGGEASHPGKGLGHIKAKGKGHSKGKGKGHFESYNGNGNGKWKGKGNGNGNGKDKSKGKGKGKGECNENAGGFVSRFELDFDPRGELVEVLNADGEVVFSGVMEGQIPGVNIDVEDETTLTPGAADPDAAGTINLAVDLEGETSLTVDVSNLAAGAYDVVIDGTVRGTLTVAATGTGTIVFSTIPLAGEVLLDFDVEGETLEIRQGATVFLSGTIATL
ncbi:MAG TPA: hypothetical protein VFG14_19960 [Chthoniobacteraceae bacterium]|nr:hypothetical protein [Chthoniobacteraceae bacterium]